jgi:hypothetical protein
MMYKPTLLAAACLLALGGPRLPAAPPAPKAYQVELRYSIPSSRDQHVEHFDAMVGYLKSVGFRPDAGLETDREDPTKNVLTGTVPAANVAKLLDQPSVRSLLLKPAGYKPPDADTQVKVRLELARGFPLERQRLLASQALTILEELGFREAVGYDNRGHTRLVGTIPAGQLSVLLKDLRGLPSGWFAPRVPAVDLPAPLKTVSPVLITEVVPEPEGVAPPRELPAPKRPGKGEEHLLKVSPELRALMAQEGEAAKPARMEVILAFTPGADDRDWQRALTGTAPGLAVEGRLGPLVTVTARAGEAGRLAALPSVSVVRLPRPARPAVAPAPAAGADNAEALRASGLERLHKMGLTGRGIRLAVVDGDFRGREQHLPGVRYIDLTAERNLDFQPEPFPGDAKALGHGTQCALAVKLAAPKVDLTLVRIDPAAPHQLQAVARYINGENFFTDSLVQRGDELDALRGELKQRRQELLIERKIVLGKFIDVKDREMLMRKKPDDLTPFERSQLADIKRRDALLANEAKLEKDEEIQREREARMFRLLRDLRGLRGTEVVSSSLVWTDGYPVDGGSALSSYLNDRPFRAALWFQSAGNTHGQSWSGLFRDADGNGVMEFATPKTPLPPGRWTPELNFLAWQPYQGKQKADLPDKARVRVSIQWREPHAPEFLRRGEDLYREPLASLRLVVLRQRDPSGKELPADEMEAVAESSGLPQRLENQPTFGIYEQAVEFTVDKPGRYALRVEGRVPPGIRPPGVPSLPIQQVSWELRPRIFVGVEDEASRAAGRAVFADFPTDQGNIGMPGDAQGVITVGAADFQGQPRPYSAAGPPHNLELLLKPTVLAYDGLRLGDAEEASAYGSDVAAPFAAGMAASALTAGTPRLRFLEGMQISPGKLLRVPEPAR